MDLTNYEAPRVLVKCRSKLALIKTIKEKINDTLREVLFRQTCFRWILDQDDWTESILIHYMLGGETKLSGDETDIVPLYYHIVDDFQIQFSREEFCLVTGLRFGVEYSDEYDNDEAHIPFRRRVFPSSLDGILKLVLLGVEDRRRVPHWILRFLNDRVAWDK
nr:phospholipase-like protein [Tanacetum cinerariifolium]